MSQQLYDLLVENGDYTKSYDDFQLQFSNSNSVDKLYSLMVENGDYTKSKDQFKARFFSGVVSEERTTTETKTEVKKDDFVSSIPGLKEKLVKTQETKTPKVSVSSPKKTTATKVEEPIAETVAENSTPSSVLGLNIENDQSFFNKSEEQGVLELRELYPGFNFEQKTLGEGGGLDAITVSTKDGKKSASFDMNIGGFWNLYGGQYSTEQDGRNRSFDILTDFINANTSEESTNESNKNKKERFKVLTEVNKQVHEAAKEEVEIINRDFNEGSLFKVQEIPLFDNPAWRYLEGIFEPKHNKQPYAKELKQASDELKKELGGDKPTEEQIHNRAKDIIINKIQEEKLTEVIESPSYQHNYSYNIGGGEKGFDSSTKAQKYNIAAKEFSIDFIKDIERSDIKAKELEDGQAVIRLNEINSIINDPNKQFPIIEGDKVLKLKNGKSIPERTLNELISLNSELNYKIKALNNFNVSIQERAASYEDNEAAIDVSRRNYGKLEEFLVETGLGAGELLMNTTAGMSLFGGGDNKSLREDVTGIKTKIQNIRDSYSKDIEFDDAFSSAGNFATFAAQELSNQIPIFAALAIPGGQAAIGFGAFGDQYINLANERDTPLGRQKSDANIWWSSVGFGASELVFESLTTLPLIRAAKKGFTITPGNKTLFEMNSKKYFQQNVGKAAYGSLSEPIGEGMTQITQNIIDGRPLSENLDHAMFSGLMFGTTLASAPFAKGVYLSQFNDHSQMQEVRRRVGEIKKINGINKDLENKIKNFQTKENILSRRDSEGNADSIDKAKSDIAKAKSDIQVNNKIISDLQAENIAEMQGIEKNLKGTSNDALGLYFQLDAQQEGIKIEAQEVAASGSLTDSQKKERFKALQAQFDFVQGKKNIFRDKKAFGDEYTAFSGLKENKDKVAEIEEEARGILIAEGKKDPTTEQIFYKSKILYNTQKINDDYTANSKKGLNKGIINAQTKKEAIDKIKELADKKDKNENPLINEKNIDEAIEGIKNGNHGVTITDTNGKVYKLQVVESMAADDRLETRTHEVGHDVFIRAISEDPNAFNDLSNTVIDYLKDNNPEAYKRVALRLGNQTDSDEVIMLFLEEVASGKVDIKKSEKAGFFATLMNKGIEEVGGRAIDLRGETDAINFLIGIAKKIKDGTITNKDIKDIRSNIIAKEAREGNEEIKRKEKELEADTTNPTTGKKADSKFSSALESINNLIPSDVKTKEDYQEFVRDRKRFAPLGKALEENGVISNYVKSKSVGDEYVDAMESVTDRVIGLRGTFNPERLREDGTKVGKEAFGEFIFANTNFAKRDAKKALAIRKIESDKTTSIDTKEAREIEDQSTIDESTSGRSDGDTKKINVLKFTGVSSKINELMNVVDIMPVGNNTFKTVDEYTGKAAEIIFDIPAEKATKGNKNLSHRNRVVNGMMELSQAGKIQNFYRVEDNLEKIVKIMVPENVTQKTGDISEVGENVDVARDIYGRSIGLKGKVLEYFFNKTGKRSQGLTTQPNVWELKPEFKNPSKETLDKLRSDLGITPQGQANVSDRAFNGQLLKGIAEYQAYQTALSITQRKLDAVRQKAATQKEKSAISQDIANVTAAQSKVAFSSAIDKIVDNVGNIEINFELEQKHINKVLSFHLGEEAVIYDFKTKDNIDDFFSVVREVVIPSLPKELAQSGLFFKSDRHLGKSKNKIVTIEGKKIKLKDYYKQQRDKLFESLKDEDYGKPFTGAGAKYKYGIKYATYFGTTADEIERTNKKGKKIRGNKGNPVVMTIAQTNEMHMSMHEQLWQRVNTSIRKNPKINAPVWGNYFSFVGNNTEHPHRMGAEFIGWSINPLGYDGKLYEWEHAMPATRAYLYLIHASLGGYDFKTTYGLVQNNYKLIALDNYDDKIKLKGAKRTTSMGEGWTMLDDFFDRYFDEVVAAIEGGIDPKGIMHTTGKTFDKVYNVNSDGNHIIVKPGINSSSKFSKAIGTSRTVNPARGISVLDFDDTLATTKSGVRYTLPNPDGTPQPKKKVIFMAGGPGSGKSNVINQLGLKEQGFKVVNQDISLEWLMKNHGMPTDMREFTPEQASEFGKLSAEARGIALKKRIKYQGEGDGVIIDGTGASLNVMKKNIQDFKDKGYDVQMIFVETSQETALSRNKARKERSLRTGIVIKTHDSVQANKEAYKELFGERFAEVNTDNLKQGDVMPADVVNKVNDFTSGYIKGRLNAGEYATKGEELKQQGAEFDFSEFNQVVEGKTAPLFNKAMKLQEKFTSKDMFVLTARPAESNQAIFEFLQANGLNIPIENIVGLGSSLSSDKALWMAGKVGEGYNDFYFADDILENVQAVSDMLEQFDVKSKVRQAKRDFVLGDPKVTKLLDEKSMNDVKDVDGLANPGVYSNVKFSKSHRAEYENTVAKNRPDLSSKEVTATIDKMFDYIDGLDVPNKRKYEQITTKWLATSNIKLPEDSYKIQQAVEIAELKKEDIFSYKNPNEIIEKYAGAIKVKPISPVGIKEFTRATGFNDPITTEYGIVEYEVEETREAQQKVRDIVNTHWGPNSNPWCITKIDKDGNLSEDAWRDWTSYGKGPKRIVFQNGKLLAMKANYEYWGKMNKHSEGPIIQIKEGNVTNTTELVVGDGGIVDPIIRETRTVSKDGNTVTTNIFKDSQDGYADGTTIVENRIKGVKIKETRFDPDGSKVNTQEFNKKGKPTTSYQFNPNGKVKSINGHLQQQAITEAGLDVNAREDADIDLTNELVVKVGDIIENNYTETETDGTTTDYFYGRALVGDQVMEIGFESKSNLDIADVTKTIDGKTRLDIGKVIREVDPNVKGLPKTGVKFSKGISKEFNDIIEQSTGVGSEKVFSDAQAKIRGNKRRFDNIVPYSVQDLMGLLYNFVGKGKVGEQHMEFFKKALIDPFARAINELNQSKQSSAGDYSNLTKAFPNVKKKLNKEIEGGDYTYDQAIRVYLWNKAGFEVPGLSKRDLNALDSIVKNDPELQAFADALGLISKKEEGYAKPGEHWLVENIASDLLSDGSIGDARSEFLAEWQQNADEIFSKENLNKIQAIYGNKFREALEDILYRMKNGTNRPTGSSRLTNNFMNWINNSTGAIMFFNMRSALLQTLSTTNYINWTDNNPLKAAMAFANQKQYWSDFSALFNSDFLKQRRSGNQRSINEAELTTAVANSDNKAKAAIAWLLQKGFLPTQIMDSFAISSGGATFYRNRINKYIKEGMSPEQAREKAFLDFQEITEATQQSARPDMISQQQASPLGRLILSFQNTPMQYARIMNKAARDIVNGRGDQKSNISKIVYYGALQSIIFAALQSAIFASLGDDEEEEFDKKKQRIVGSMVDGWLAGLGVAGKAIGTIERSIKEYLKQKERGFNSDHAQTIIQLLGFSPPIGSKLRKIYSAIQTEEFNKGVSEKRGFTLDNPTWSSWGNVIEGFTNVPLGRMANKMLNIDNALDSQNEWWERAALLLGWNTWDLGIKDPDITAVKGEIKEERKVEKKKEAVIKKEEKKQEIKEENISKEEANIELQKKEIEDGNESPDCAAINKRGERCGTKIEKGSTYCTIHTKVEQNDGGKKTQCGKTKKDGKRCKMQTSNKSGYCYYHD
jgi:predicted kinase